jgi:hypothetical protein
MTVIGIDPGINGGIAWITDGNPCVEKMPDTLQDLWDLLQDIRATASPPLGGGSTKAIAYLEEVHAAPSAAKAAGGKVNKFRMGTKSAFTFGRGYGNLEMGLTAAGIPLKRVKPQDWQEALGCLTKGNKNITKSKAQELFPTIKCTHAVSDALLIAEYGARQH